MNLSVGGMINSAKKVQSDFESEVKAVVGHTIDAVAPDGAKDMAKIVGVGLGIMDKEEATITVDPESNTATADLDYSKVPKEHRSRVKRDADNLATELHLKKTALKEAEANGASKAELQDLQVEVDALQYKLTEVKYHVETAELSGWEIAAYILSPAGGVVVDRMIESHADMEDIDKSFGTMSADKAPGPSGSGRSSAGSAAGTSSTGGEYSAEEMVRIMREDPDKFKEMMSGEDKDAKMMMMQDYMQSQNRFWSMMTSLQNAEHQTTKAILSNLRV